MGHVYVYHEKGGTAKSFSSFYKDGKAFLCFISRKNVEVTQMGTNNQEMPTKYDPNAIEKDRYTYWLEGKFFEAQNDKRKIHIQSSFLHQT